MNDSIEHNLNINLDVIEIFLYFFSTILFAITDISIMFYITLLYTFLSGVKKYYLTKDVFFIMKILLMSMIIPNNYMIIVFSMIFGLMSLKGNKKIIIAFFIIMLLLNIFINDVKVVNLGFGLFYLLPVLLMYLFMFKFKDEISLQSEKFVLLIKKILQIEIVSIMIYFAFNFNWILQGYANDWLTGTFGYHQGNIFLYFTLFSFLIFYENYEKTKKRSSLVYTGISLILAVLTNSISLFMLFVASYAIVILLSKNLKKVLKNVFIIGFIIILFMLMTPEWIKGYIVKLTNYDYFIQTVAKMQAYNDTFVTIPRKDFRFLLVGNGIGQYSSRAALTCTGRYVESYTKYFPISVSEYTNTYILRRYVKYNLEEGQGTLYSPFSTIISLQGEYGIIGCIIFLVVLLKMWKNSSKISKIWLLFFFFSCFIENYLEFQKIIFLVFTIYFLYTNNNLKREEQVL